jgi:8-oxo-dGTP pyrophosphatase MutT (NUDIX family)
MRPMVEAAPAATVILLRDRPKSRAETSEFEVLLLHRNSQLAFHGGAWVFPGGRIDPVDAGPGGDAATARRAAAREAREEAGIAVDPEALVQVSHWTTPEGQPKRFATWFFAGLGDTSAVQVDLGEIQAHAWRSPREALAAQRAGEIELPPPTFVTLTGLLAYGRAADALTAFRAAEPRIFLPRVVRIPGGACSLYPADAGWEERDPERPGPRHRLVMLGTDWSYLREA